ncbi:MAG: ribulose-phosphate 3-epimerase [Candidatus Poseidoniales archaeon]|tara:strand:+ start:489 stop:1112 length:624 start_codon:yes stop_codon:yes gene_type:complete
MVSIAPSMLGADFGKMREAAELVAPHSSYLHMDVMDGHFVPNLTMGVDLVKALKGIAPLDVHLMVTDPLNFIDDFHDAGAEIISIHVEANNPRESLQKINEKNIKSGIAFNPSTSKDKIIPFLDIADMILVMSVEPGYCGQSFHENAINRVKFFKTNYPEKLIEVDGGVSTANSALLAENGADILVAGSAIFKSEDPINTIAQMKKS